MVLQCGAPLNVAGRRALDGLSLGTGDRRGPIAPGRIGRRGVSAAGLQFNPALADPRDAPPAGGRLRVAHRRGVASILARLAAQAEEFAQVGSGGIDMVAGTDKARGLSFG